MKIINYDYGYNNYFDCSIHGKIIMDKKEWGEAISFLLRGAKRWLPSYPYIKNILKEDIKRSISVKNGKLYNVRVSATEVIAEKYNLKKYKRGNYVILVKN
jgi:hypothetical protein